MSGIEEFHCNLNCITLIHGGRTMQHGGDTVTDLVV